MPTLCWPLLPLLGHVFCWDVELRVTGLSTLLMVCHGSYSRPFQDTGFFKGPGKMTILLPSKICSAHSPGLGPLFKFTLSATSLGPKPAKGTARSVLGQCLSPQPCIHWTFFMIYTMQRLSSESFPPKKAPGVLMKFFNPFTHTYLSSTSKRLPVTNSQSYKVIVVSIWDRLIGSYTPLFCPDKADVTQSIRHYYHSHIQSLHPRLLPLPSPLPPTWITAVGL